MECLRSLIAATVTTQQLLRPDVVLLKPTFEQEKELFCLAEQSSLLWNQANYQRRRYAADRVRKGKYGRLDVIYDGLSNRSYAHIPVKIAPARQANQTTEKYGSIDLGICNIATMYAPDERPLAYSGRSILSDWVYHTKKIAKMQSQLKQKQYTSRRIQKMFRKRQRRFKHAINAMLRNLFGRAAKMDITHLTVGDLNRIRNNNDLGTHTNQKLHNFWSHASILKRIGELGEEFGIQVDKVSEKDTSKTCAMCGEQHNGRKHRGLHFCKRRNVVTNADVNGAYNIYNAAVYGSLCPEKEGSSGSRALASPLMLRWEYHRWH